MAYEKERNRMVQGYMKILKSGKYDEILPLLDSKQVTKFANSLLRFCEVDPPHFEKMRGYLNDAIVSGEKLKNARLERARLAEAEFKKSLDAFLKKVKGWRTEVLKAEKLYEKEGKDQGLVEVDVKFHFTNYNNQLPASAKVRLEFPGSKVTLQSALYKGTWQSRGIMLSPKKSTVIAEVTVPRKVKPKLKMSNSLFYKPLKPGGVLALAATEDHATITQKATSGQAAAEKAGTKGSFGIDWRIFSGGVEITKEKELTKTHSKQMSFTIWVPKGSMSLTQK